MMSKRRMPPMRLDEVILLVDTYYCLQNTEDLQTRVELIEELSQAMRVLPFNPEYRDDPTYRSVDGMKMCLANVAWSDPYSKSTFGHGSALQRKVLDYYSDKKEILHSYALAIKSISKHTFQVLGDYDDFIGGALLPSFHIHLEKNDKTIKDIQLEARSQQQSKCRVCGVDLSDNYGLVASNIMEVHINLPLVQNTPKTMLLPSDLIIICPTCHKLAHLKPSYYEIDNLKMDLKAGNIHV